MTAQAKIAIAGAGQIGRRHAEAIRASKGAVLHSIVDPAPAAAEFAKSLGARCFASLDEAVADKPDGVILATPNQLHFDGAMQCIGAGIPVLVEKPLCADLANGEALVAAAVAARVPVATGHHRRHNPLIRRAQTEIAEGTIGEIVSVQATTWFFKPDDYFNTEWRRRAGAGPILLNLVHDIDLMQFLCGPIAAVHAFESNAVRGNEVEETAVVLLRFANGALGTLNVSDTIVAPWSWELTARENPSYPPTGEACYWIGGTHGSLELPGLQLWANGKKRGWLEPISATQMPFGFADPLVLQVEQFAAVIRGEEAPLCSASDGLAALRVIAAIKASTASGAPMRVEPNAEGGR